MSKNKVSTLKKSEKTDPRLIKATAILRDLLDSFRQPIPCK